MSDSQKKYKIKLDLDSEIILKLDRIEAEIELLREPLLINNKQIVRIKEKVDELEKNIKKL